MHNEEITIDLRELWRILKKNFKIIFAVTLLFSLLGVAYLFLKKPVYESTSLFRIQIPHGIANSPIEWEGTDHTAQKSIGTYVAILKSRSVVEPIIAQLENNAEKVPSYEEYSNNRILTENLRDTEILKISTRASSAEKAQEFNRLLTEKFLNRLTEISRNTQSNTRQFIEGRVEIAQQELTTAEDTLNNFKKEKNIFSPNEQMQIISSQVKFLDKIKAENQINLESARARNDAANSQFKISGGSLANNASLRSYQVQLAELEAKRISYLEQYTEEHPLVKEVNESIAGIKKLLQEEIEKVAAQQAPSEDSVYQSLLMDKFKSEAEIAVAENNLEMIAQIERKYQNEVTNLTDTEREYLELTRNLNLAQEIYVMLAKRLEEAKVAEVSVINEVSVVDVPNLPEKPVEPKKSRVLPIAALVGFILSCGFFILRAIMDNTLKNSNEIRQKFNLPTVTIPRAEKLFEAYCLAGVNLKQWAEQGDAKKILVTSTTRGEGKTITVAQLGIFLAKSGEKVCLVDCDFRASALHAFFGKTLKENCGISDCLRGDKTFSDALTLTGVENLSLIMNGGTSPELLNSNALEKFLNELAENFDRVLIDSPCFSNAADAAILVPKTDGVILVIESRKVPFEVVAEMKILLEQTGAKILGVILTKLEKSFLDAGY